MPNVDLSEATIGRVAGQTVDMLRIANEIVWQPSVTPVPTYTIFGGSEVPNLGSYDDAGSDAWLTQQFQFVPGPDLEILEVGLYVPEGSLLIGRTGYTSLQYKDTPYLRGNYYLNTMRSNDLVQIMGTPLEAGWNWYPLVHPVLWNSVNYSILAGYSLDTGYLYSSTFDTAEKPSSDGGNMVLAQSGINPGDVGRSFYGAAVDLTITDARSYGVDIRVRLAS